jgi:hypothetical protein
MAGSCPVPDDRVWFLRISSEEADALRIAFRLIEAQPERAHVELRKERGYGIEVIEIHRKQALRAKPR